MDNTDLLQQKINDARAMLSKESLESIDAVDWRSTIQSMNTKYSPEQLEELELETELMLCGLLLPEDFHKEIQERMKISGPEADFLVKEMDRMIFQKMKHLVEQKIIDEAPPAPKVFQAPTKSSPAPFAVKAPALNTELPPIQKDKEPEIANGQFDSQKELYTIAKEEKLSIEQMGKFEEVTNKIISGAIHPDQYEKMLESELGLTPEKAIKLSHKTNEKVLLRMREEMKKAYPPQAQPEPEPSIPTPPYKQELKAPAPIAPKPTTPNTATSDDQMFTNSGVEVIPESPIPNNLPTTEATIKEEEVMLGKDGVDIMEPNIQTPTPPIQTSPTTEQDTLAGIENPSKSKTHIISGEIPERKINVVQDRLSKPTISLQSASDQSPVSTTPKSSKDPYREPIE